MLPALPAVPAAPTIPAPLPAVATVPAVPVPAAMSPAAPAALAPLIPATMPGTPVPPAAGAPAPPRFPVLPALPLVPPVPIGDILLGGSPVGGSVSSPQPNATHDRLAISARAHQRWVPTITTADNDRWPDQQAEVRANGRVVQTAVPIEYSIVDGMVRARATGALDDASLISYVERLLVDPLYTPQLPVLFDATAISSLELSGAGVRDASAAVRENPEHPIARVALVVSGPAAYGMARMYGLLRDVEVAVFEDRELALAWLTSPRTEEAEAG